MIVKDHEVPINLLSLISINHRLQNSPSKKQAVTNEIMSYYSGYKGELALDYYLKFIDQKDFSILHSLRLPFTNSFYQMDTLLLNPNFFLKIEVKNHTGYIRFNHEKGLMYQQNVYDEKSYQDPLLQSNTQVHQLKSWLFNKGLHHIPVEPLIVFVNQNVKLAEDRDDRIIYGFQLMQKFQEILSKHQTPLITPRQLEHIQTALIKQNKPLHSDMLKHLKIMANELTYGVICPNCLNLPMERDGTWKCLYCRKNFRKAHLYTLIEYALLFDTLISNKQARKLFQVDSIHLIQKLLARAALPFQGEYGYRKYKLNFDLPHDGQFLLDNFLKTKQLDEFYNHKDILLSDAL